jgi:hypothetical protein
MRCYKKHHQYYAGIDLHARKIYICIIDSQGNILLHRNYDCSLDNLIAAIGPYLPDVVVGVECVFTWYWIADFCQDNNIPFILGHALYMKAIHGGKTKNDKIDSSKIASLIRGGLFPNAYVYPQKMRATRDLLRRRQYFTHKQSELIGNIKNTASQYNTTHIPQGHSVWLQPEKYTRYLSESGSQYTTEHRNGLGNAGFLSSGVEQN